MAFHVACPITCRRICDCELGFPAGLRGGRARGEFSGEIARLEEFLRDPWCVRAGGGGATVQVLVPRVAPSPAPPSAADDGGADGEDAATAQAKRAAMQRQAMAASLAAEDYVRRLETEGDAELQGEAAKEDQGSSTVKIMCRICFSGEKERSERAIKMLSCKICDKKYHRSCLKSWAEYRDLFHWSSWACPSCRICEVCRRAGDPNKLMYCKRCDAAYHCYCQQPAHKNVSHGPYLCPKHTRCHSCGSSVPGSGLSTRWFLGYTCCDACGRLFVKGNYCPVCLKVYRDSETTPMVCCDVCERWVHCVCDGISDEKYQQFQADQNLYYKCAACRGDCYQVKDIDDAVRELWKRRDEADRDQIASLRAAAGLPSQEEIFSISPYSDDDHSVPVILKTDYGRPLKFSVKGISDKSTKNSKEPVSNKKTVKKKGCQIKFVHKLQEPYQNFERQHEARSLESSFRDQKIDGPEILSSFMIRSPGNDEVKSCVNQVISNNHSFVKEIAANNADRVSKVQLKSKLQGLHIKECAGKNESKSETMKGPKLVIHLGAKNRNTSSSPRSETSSCHREHDTTAFYAAEVGNQLKTEYRENYVLEAHDGIARLDAEGARFDNTIHRRSSKHGGREKKISKPGKVTDMHRKSNGNIHEECELSTTCISTPMPGKRSTQAETADEATLRNDVSLPKKQHMCTPGNLGSDDHHNNSQSKFIPNTPNDLKPLLKLKFKNPYFEQRSSWAPRGEEENSVKGQRSKRKRPSTEKVSFWENESNAPMPKENPIDEAMDAKILQKLGKDAIGKRVEVHQSDNSWQQGVVSSIILGTSTLTVRLDDGRSTTLELGKQGVRFVTHKGKRANT